MIHAEFPINEAERLRVLQGLQVLDTLPEATFDELAELASQICDTPISLVSLVDGHRQWYKSHFGTKTTETPRNISFCGHAIHGRGLFEVEDARRDPRFHDNPLVTGKAPVVFYAGFPLEMSEQIRIGTLCVIDDKPRQLTPGQRKALQCLANQVRDQLRLRKANLDLEKSFKARSLFFSAITHEIRTPLNGIVGVASILAETLQDAESLDHVKTIQYCGSTMVNIVNQVLEFSKLESGRVEIEQKPFDLEHMLVNLRMLLTPIAVSKGLRLTLVSSSDCPRWVVGDATRTSQVLINLIGNAVKFSREGEILVTVQARGPQREASGQEVEFEIRDQGIGIPDDFRDSIFTPFSQVNGDLVKNFGGTGLGLAITKGLVEAMGGSIGYESKMGEGSRFRVILPLRIPDHPEDPMPAEAKEDWSRAPLSERIPLRILIAEDNPVNMMITDRLLSKMGYRAEKAIDGSQAVSLASQLRFDLILMDCEMPIMDGLKATRRILDSHVGPHPPVIFALTAYATREDRDRFLALGMSEVLTKPISYEALREAIELLLDDPGKASTGKATPG